MNSIMEEADDNTLILLDEIGMGTDPAQGAALAQAILEQLLVQGSKVVVTTHFTRLKAFASTDPRCAMAAMHIVQGIPTHKLQWGEVGESEALALAERMKLPEFLIIRARSLLNTGERQLSDLISQVESQRLQLDKERQEASFIRSELERQQDVLERKNRVWDERKAILEEKLKQDTRAELKSIEHRANKLLRQIRESGSLKDARKKATTLKGLRDELAPASGRPDPISEDVILHIGDKVHVILLDATGVIQSIKGGKMDVVVNGMSMRVSREDVALPMLSGHPMKVKAKSSSKMTSPKAKHSTKSKRSKKSRRQSDSKGVEVTVIRSSHNTCDLRGARVEEAFVTLEQYFDQQIIRGRKRIFILHGHGTGALRSGIRGWLSSSGYVADWRPANADEGGDAFTVVDLK
jgi:DNA mismatch repair protein MutS2